MITVISDEQEIVKLHKTFHKQLNDHLDKKIRCWVGYPGGANEDTVRYSDKLNLWLSTQELDSRFWNGFGLGEPIEGRNNSLSGEINFPYKGIDRRIAGAFARDNGGKVLILHRGKIGGGKEGIGKRSFIDNFRGDFIRAFDGDRDTDFCFVGELGSPLLHKQVAVFIEEISRIKELINSGKDVDFMELNEFSFTDEKSGTSTTDGKERVIERTHGIIVNALAKELKARNYKIGNDANRDLFIHNNKEITSLFEIKTCSTTQNICSAVGQLLIYSIPIKRAVKLYFVTYDKLKRGVEQRLKELQIEVIYFVWENDQVIFLEFDNKLKS